MNIFILDLDPFLAAQSLCDPHVRKMGIESVQLLCTAHRVLDGQEYTGVTKTGRKIKRWALPNHLAGIYEATHVNHGCAKWVRESWYNYQWLYCHSLEIFRIWTAKRNKIHKCETILKSLPGPPKNIPDVGWTRPYLAMPDEYKVPIDCVRSYQNLYLGGKRHLAQWTYNKKPDWYN